MPKSEKFKKISMLNQAATKSLMKKKLCSASLTLKRIWGIELPRYRNYPKIGRRRVGGQGKDTSTSNIMNILKLFNRNKTDNAYHNKDGQ